MLIKRISNKLIDRSAWAVSLFARQAALEAWRSFRSKVQWYAARRRFKSVGRGAEVEAPFSFLNPQNVSIGSNFSARSNLLLETFEEYQGMRFAPQIVIGNNVSFYRDCHVGCINKIEIGNNVLLASRVYMTDHSHGDTSSASIGQPPVMRKLVSKGPVIIRDNAWIGEGVAIMPGVTIGENSIIGANSVVTKDIPPNCVAAGAPAVVIKKLD